MALPDIIFQKGQGGLGRPLPGQDFISGFAFYNDSKPTGFASAPYIQKVFSLEQAEALGIETGLGTSATGSVTIVGSGNSGDTLVVLVNAVAIGSTTAPSNSPTNCAIAINAAINAATGTNGGYTSTQSGPTVTITAPVGINTLPITFTTNGTFTATIVQFSGGTNGFDVEHYHISEYFRVQPKGVLYIGFFDVPVSFDATVCSQLQTYANGEIRQVAMYQTEFAFATAQITALQADYNTNYDLHQPFEILYGADIVGVTLSALTDLGLLDSENVSLVIAQDALGTANDLFVSSGVSITAIGTLLGTVSLSRVHEDIGWVGKFNLDDGTNLDTLAFANGDLYTDTADSLLTTLDTYHYIFLRKLVGTTGSFWNFGWTATLSTSDYVTIENNRTIDKAIRNVRTNLLPTLNSPLYVNADGTLTNSTIAYFQGLAQSATDDMQRNGELSASKVIIDPSQNVLSTSELVLTIQLVPVGVAREIIVNIGFTVNIS